MVNSSKENLSNEYKRPSMIKTAYNEFVKVDNIDTYVLECNIVKGIYEDKYRPGLHKKVNISIQGKEFKSRLEGNYKDDLQDICTSCYVIMHIFSFAGLEYIITPKVCLNKENAILYAKNPRHRAEFKFISEDNIKFKSFRKKTVLGRDRLISNSIIRCPLINISRDFIENCNIIYKFDNENEKTDDFEDEEDIINIDKEYKSVTAKLELSGSILYLKTENNNIEWEFERNESGLFCDIARDIIEKSTDNGLCVFTIVNQGDKESMRRSNCGNWWISGI